jgi:hypothetical protein
VRALVLLSLPVALAAGSAHALSTVTCQSSSFRLGPSAEASEKTGQHTATFALTNTSAAGCTTRGYPTIVLLDAGGRSLRFTYHDGGDQMISPQPPRRVTVAPGGKAYFAFNKYRCDIRATAVARFVLVSLPGSSSRLRLGLQRYPIIDFCSERPSRIVSVSPIVSRLGSAFLGR